jgi:tetratricopeptide (TPR) repeat protein
MDGRMSAFALLGLVLACSGCVTTTETQVSFPKPGEAPRKPLVAAKEEPKQPAPPRLVVTVAEMKESDADAAKDQPEKQARLRDEARRAYMEVIKAEPDNFAAYRGLARVYARLGDYERAQETYKKALTRQPRDVHIWFDMGMMYDRRKDWAEGIKCFRKGLDIDPENQDCLKGLGFTLARAGQMEASMAYLTRATGSVAMAHYNVARMLLHLGEQATPAERAAAAEQARRHLHLALQENPALERAHQLLATVEPAPTAPQGTVGIRFMEPAQ